MAADLSFRSAYVCLGFLDALPLQSFNVKVGLGILKLELSLYYYKSHNNNYNVIHYLVAKFVVLLLRDISYHVTLAVTLLITTALKRAARILVRIFID